MTSRASKILIDQIMPIMSRNVPRKVMPAHGEDAPELIQDGAAIAAEMLENDARAWGA